MAEGGHGRRKKTAPALTLENITSALKGIEKRWDYFGIWLCVPDETRSGIRNQQCSDVKKLQQVILYILAFHPLASWRVIIDALQRMGEGQLAESIQEYAEPVTDPSLNITNLVEVINMMKWEWDDLAAHLDVPWSKREELRRQHQSVKEQNASFSSYCLSSLPGFSWARFAGALYYLEDKAALVAAKRYIKREEDPTLTLDNLLSVLERVTDWYGLGLWLDVPESKRDVMMEKESMLREWLDNHPAPSWELLAWALYRSRSGRLTEHSVLKHHIYGRYVTVPEVKRKVDACQQAIAKKGAIEQTAMQGVFIGYPRSGKTTSKKRLVSKKAEVNQASTGVAEKVTHVEIEKSTVYSSWKEITELNDETAIVVEEVVDHISHKVEEHPIQPDVSHIRDEDSHIHDEDTKSLSKGQNPNRIRAIVSKVKTMFSRKKANISIEGIKQQAKTPKDGSTTLQVLSTALQRASRSTPSHQQREQQWTLYLSDVGGQTEFQEMLPSLVSGPSLYFLTFPLHKGLNERFRVEYQHLTNGNIVPIESTSSNKEVLLQSLSSITSTRSYTKALDGKSVSPKVLLIGTHRDQIQSEQQLTEIDQQLQDIIKKTAAFKENMIVFCSESQMVFAVDNTSDDDADIQQVRDAVERLAVSTDDYRIQTPYTWMIFAATLRHLPERVLSIEKCLEVGKECGIDTKDELNNALWFLHHNVGIIRHFQDHRELQNVVIKEPQYIFDKVTELIIKTFTFQNVGPHLHEEFIKKGIFPTDMVHKLSTDSDTLTGDKFAILLEHHHIIAPIEEDGKVVKYFAPAALAHAELPPNTETKEIIPPLLVVFESGYCPNGMFGALVVNLLKKSKKSQFEWDLEEDRIYRNQICLSVGPYDSFQFSLSPTSVKIALHPPNKQNRKITLGRICCDVRSEIDESIRAVTEVLNYTDKAAHSFAFSCPEPTTNDDSHAATINFSPEGEPCTLTCLFCRKRHIDLPNGHKLWFNETLCLPPKAESISSTSESNECVMDAEASGYVKRKIDSEPDRLTATNVPKFQKSDKITKSDCLFNDLAVSISEKYIQIGVKLGLEYDELIDELETGIFMTKRGSEKAMKMLQLWKKSVSEDDFTYSALATALEKFGFQNCIQKLRSHYLMHN